MKQQNPRSERSLFTQAHTAADLQSVQGENWRSMFHQGFAVVVGVGVSVRIVRVGVKVEFRVRLGLHQPNLSWLNYNRTVISVSFGLI